MVKNNDFLYPARIALSAWGAAVRLRILRILWILGILSIYRGAAEKQLYPVTEFFRENNYTPVTRDTWQKRMKHIFAEQKHMKHAWRRMKHFASQNMKQSPFRALCSRKQKYKAQALCFISACQSRCFILLSEAKQCFIGKQRLTASFLCGWLGGWLCGVQTFTDFYWHLQTFLYTARKSLHRSGYKAR